MMITLAGGRQVEDYANTECPVCGEEIHHAVVCRKIDSNICDTHCRYCRHYMKVTQKCSYAPERKIRHSRCRISSIEEPIELVIVSSSRIIAQF